ncbi:MAG: hypothetical protein P4L98_07975 [Ancalomicrobiaceae bacterium]|nr:hypothetical protein [Ancalomicrobiaceae bacterium]
MIRSAAAVTFLILLAAEGRAADGSTPGATFMARPVMSVVGSQACASALRPTIAPLSGPEARNS